MTTLFRALFLTGFAACLGQSSPAADFQFNHHYISRDLPAKNGTVGDYGLTALVDVDRDGNLDICSKPWGPQPWNGNSGKMHVDFLENLQKHKP
jgi:hypothetical protein